MKPYYYKLLDGIIVYKELLLVTWYDLFLQIFDLKKNSWYYMTVCSHVIIKFYDYLET